MWGESSRLSISDGFPDLVSICIPAYKTRDLRVAIGSALAQTYPNIEVIVSDDCPTNAVAELCATFGSNVRYVVNQERFGQGKGNAFNLVRESRGKYLKYLLDDDFLAPTCVRALVSLAEATPEARLIASLRYVTDGAGDPSFLSNPMELRDNSVIPGDDVIRHIGTKLENPIGEFSTVLMYRDDLIEVANKRKFDLNDGAAIQGLGDVALWITLLERGPLAIHATPQSYFRCHAEANSNPGANPEFVYAVTDWALVLRYVAGKGLLDSEQFAVALGRLRGHYEAWAHACPQLPELLESELSSLRNDYVHLC